MSSSGVLRPLGWLCLAAISAATFAAWPAASQTHFETGGVVSKPDLFETDGFKPVWQQQQEQAAKKAAAAAAKAKREAAAKAKQIAEAKKAKAKQDAKQDPAAEKQPVRTETTQFDQWVVTCREVVGGKQPKECAAALRVVQPNKQLVLLWEAARDDKGVIRTVIQTPTGVLVQQGVDVKVGDEIVTKFAYFACIPNNCEAAGVIDDKLLKRLAAASEVTLTIHARDGRDIHFKFPVKGIDKAVAALRS